MLFYQVSDVVFGKETSIELVVIDEDGNVQTVCDQPIFGIIKDLAVLPWNEKFRARRPQTQDKDLLVALLLPVHMKIAHAISVISQHVDAGRLVHSIAEVPNSSGLAFLFRASDVLLMDFRGPHNPLRVYKTCLNVLEEQTYMDDSCKLHDLDDEDFSVVACVLLQLSDFDPMCIDNFCNQNPKVIQLLLGKANQGKFALDVAVKTLGLYKGYFDTPYTLPKLDVVAIPDLCCRSHGRIMVWLHTGRLLCSMMINILLLLTNRGL
ncbi:hypothetical protein KIW84_065881 [Lathyrus oleraceus]|uniref:RSE1/DDB1/CPSF1 first beta-propeller domain-containing protein n=1 Tax=Pisum sativum TaxID=3888 RepID=A0A9D5AAV3_PEA|nr:hypothetical protein KIW84_065881 [Pisum sativum]